MDSQENALQNGVNENEKGKEQDVAQVNREETFSTYLQDKEGNSRTLEGNRCQQGIFKQGRD